MKTSEINTQSKALKFSEIQLSEEPTILSGQKTFDKWFSRKGGAVRGSSVFVTGTSGAGKTTLLINYMKWCAAEKSAFYSRESLLSQVKEQLDQLVIGGDALFYDEKNAPTFNDFMVKLDEEEPSIVIVDSLQVIANEDYPNLSENEACELIRTKLSKWARNHDAVCFIIGHNTKEGEFAGSNTNMQMVDAHMVMERDKKTGIRKIYWGQKNRKGPMGLLYYEINDDCSISFFTEEEYESKLTPNVKFNFVDEIDRLIKRLNNSIDKNHINYAAFMADQKAQEKVIRKRCGDNVAFLNQEKIACLIFLLKKYGME